MALSFNETVYQSLKTRLSRLLSAIEGLYFAHDVQVKVESDRESWHVWLTVPAIEGDILKHLYEICGYSLVVEEGRIKFHFTSITAHYYLMINSGK